MDGTNKAIKSVSAPDITADIYNALQKKLVELEATIRANRKRDENISLFKSGDRKLAIDVGNDTLPLIFTDEEQTQIIQAIYPDVERGLFTYIYFCTREKAWSDYVGIDIYKTELESYKRVLASHVMNRLSFVIDSLDIYDNQKPYVASLFLGQYPIYSSAVEPFVEALESCDSETEIVRVVYEDEGDEVVITDEKNG